MSLKRNVLNLSPADFAQELTVLGAESFRLNQVYDWIFHKRVFDFCEMNNLPLTLREQLFEKLCIDIPTVDLDLVQPSSDGSRKFLLRAADGALIESILMRAHDRLTLCVSCMIGCPLGCKFCATGTQIGFIRNLSAAEIVGQLLAIEHYTQERVTNIVFMGMGEPMLNREAIERVLDMLCSPRMLGFSPKRIVLSTAGVYPGLADFINRHRIRLAVSLHFPTDAERSVYMPVNRAYPLAELMQELGRVKLAPREHITIEYIMLAGINDTDRHMRMLVRLLAPFRVKINLIPYNVVETFDACPSGAERIDACARLLVEKGVTVTVRRSSGVDVDGGCGQFALRKKNFSARVKSVIHQRKKKPEDR